MDGQAVKPAAREISRGPEAVVNDLMTRAHPRGVPNCSLFKDHQAARYPAAAGVRTP